MALMDNELGPAVNLTRMDLRDWRPIEEPPEETPPPPATWKTVALFVAAFCLCAVVGMAWAWGKDRVPTCSTQCWRHECRTYCW